MTDIVKRFTKHWSCSTSQKLVKPIDEQHYPITNFVERFTKYWKCSTSQKFMKPIDEENYPIHCQDVSMPLHATAHQSLLPCHWTPLNADQR